MVALGLSILLRQGDVDIGEVRVTIGTYLLHHLEVQRIVESAISIGYKLIDTASVYRNEAHIGEVIKKMVPHSIQREDIFITSKLGPVDQGSEKAKAAALTSLKSVSVDYLDLYLIHWPGVSKTKPDSPRNAELRKESWLEMEKLYHNGMFKAIGVSNYTVEHLEELLQYCSVMPAVLQVEIHPYLTQKPLREFCSAHNIHVQAYSSLGSGDGCEELLSDRNVVKIAEEQRKTCAQILLRWAIQQGISVIPKTKRIEKLKENMAIFDFQLSDEQMQRLNDLNKEEHYCWDPRCIK